MTSTTDLYEHHLLVPAARLDKVIRLGRIDLPGGDDDELDRAPWLSGADSSCRIDAEWMARAAPMQRFANEPSQSVEPAAWAELLGPEPEAADLLRLDADVAPVDLSDSGLLRMGESDRPTATVRHTGVRLAVGTERVLISFDSPWVPVLAALIPLIGFNRAFDIAVSRSSYEKLTERERRYSLRNSHARSARFSAGRRFHL